MTLFGDGPTDGELEEIVQLAEEQVKLEEEIEKASAELKSLQAAWREVAQDKLPILLREAGVNSLELKDGSKIKIDHKIFASITKDRQEQAFEWLRENGFGDLIKEKVIQEHVHPQTLKAFCREQLAKGTAIPTNLFGVHEVDQTKILLP